MKIIKNMIVAVDDAIATEVFLTLCEEQGINWRSGCKPRSHETSSDYIIVDNYEQKLMLGGFSCIETSLPNNLIRFSVTDEV